MKTLRPFAYAGADVDIIISNPNDFSKAVRELRKQNFTLAGPPDSFTTTLVRQDFEVNADLQLEVTVSSLPYVNKQILLQNVVDRKINGHTIKTLDAEAEVIVTACHALYKEHMYTLADFYNVALYVKPENVGALCELAKMTQSTAAVSALLMWTQEITRAAFGVTLPGVDAVLVAIGSHTIPNILNCGETQSPRKFSLPLVFLSLADKIYKDSYTRSSLANALYESLSQKQIVALIHHFSRESY